MYLFDVPWHFDCTHKTYKKSLELFQSYDYVSFLGPKWSTFSKDLFWKNHYSNKIFMYLLDPFIEQNFKKIIRVDPKFSQCIIFGTKMAHLPKRIFFEKSLI